jgi:hypothetical protein
MLTAGPQVAIGVRVGPAPPSLGLAAAKGRATLLLQAYSNSGFPTELTWLHSCAGGSPG